MSTRWARLTLGGLGVAVVGLASALTIVVATDDDGDSGSGNQQTTNGAGWTHPGMMDPGWMMGADGMHSYMHAALSDDDYSAMVRYIQWVRAGSRGTDPVDNATAHRIWDNMMGSGWMMGPMMMSEDRMRSYMGGILSDQDFDRMYDHMQWRWSGSNGADPLDDATAHRIWDKMMVGMNAGQWSMWDDWGSCWD